MLGFALSIPVFFATTYAWVPWIVVRCWRSGCACGGADIARADACHPAERASSNVGWPWNHAYAQSAGSGAS